ncbi:hypothetical protein D3C71_2083960 [compost metagenome]
MSISPSAIDWIRARAEAPSGTVSELKMAVRASGKSRRTSSSTRSTPGPTGTSESSAPHDGQSLGFIIEKPVRWQTSRPV